VVGVVVFAVGCSPLSEVLGNARLAVAVIVASLALTESLEGLVLPAPLAASVDDPADMLEVASLPSVQVVVLGCGDELQIGQGVVELIAVPVVDFVPFGDRSVGLFPDPSVGELSPLLAVLFPADVLSSFGDAPPHEQPPWLPLI
jgi:hypothetical protein